MDELDKDLFDVFHVDHVGVVTDVEQETPPILNCRVAGSCSDLIQCLRAEREASKFHHLTSDSSLCL